MSVPVVIPVVAPSSSSKGSGIAGLPAYLTHTCTEQPCLEGVHLPGTYLSLDHNSKAYL